MPEKWILSSKTPPPRLTDVWITRKNKVELAYLDIEKVPRWHLVKGKKTVAYDKVVAWMSVSTPKPYSADEE